MDLAKKLDEAIKQVCPIDGISIGIPSDKQTWKISFKPEATQEEKDAAQAVIDAFDLQQAESDYQALDQRCLLDEQERQACKTDPTILSLIDQTRTEWVAWANTNFPSLTTAEQNKLGVLFWVVSIGVRKIVRNGTR